MESSKLTRVIVWLRNDLRLHDNYALYKAAKLAKKGKKEVIPVFSFDPRWYGPTAVTKYGT